MKLSDIQAPNNNSRSIELQAISSINNNAVEPTKRAFSLKEPSSTKIKLTKRAFSLEEPSSTSLEEPSSTKIAKLAESIEKTPKDITLEEGSAALVEAIGCCTGIFMFLKRIFTHDIPNPSDDCFVDSSDFFINLDGAFSSPGIVNPGYIDHQDAISLAGAEVQS
ncbi:hypothetical protein [Candidatus Tisiphia endosymbiont of Ptychoptera albimana]|uniref:hypothetical protein n=1 Tax=Candidatus Tisiphia endosymbiont of Ptychoptera albimana TaxID=3066260 RepID=UPI00312CAC65